MVFGFRKVKSVLVFGGTGFVGSALVKKLLLEGLIVLVYQHNKKGFLENYHHENLIYFSTFDDDILENYKISAVFHLASMISSQKNSYYEFDDVNVKLTLEIISLVKRLKIGQFIYSSTCSLFTKPKEPVIFDENSIPNPLSYYAITKFIAEKILAVELNGDETQVSIIRFPSIFGKNESTGIIHTFLTLANQGKNIEVFSEGKRFRNLVYIDSAVEILYQTYLNKVNLKSYELFLSGSSDSMKMIDIAHLIGKITNSKSQVIPVNKFPPSDFDVFINTSKAQKLLNYKPLSIEEGLVKYIKDIENENL